MENTDVLLKIFELNSWENVGSLLEFSRKTKRGILRKENLTKIINFYLDKEEKLPAWCFTSILFDCSLNEIFPELIDLKDKILNNLGKYINEINREDFFLTGGFAVNALYNSGYSDIDVWCKGDSSRFKSENIDYIGTPKDITKIISEFDISICQLGVLFKNKKPISVYFTPLFLYTFYSKKMIIRFMPLAISYFVRDFNRETERRIDISDLYKLHLDHNSNKTGILKRTYWYDEEEYGEYCKRNNAYYVEERGNRKFPNFYDCPQCFGFLKDRHNAGLYNKKNYFLRGIGINYQEIMRWMERLKKYANRFKNYEMLYVNSETLYVNPYDE